MEDNSELKEKLEALRDRLQKASTVSPSGRDLWSTLINEMVKLNEAGQSGTHQSGTHQLEQGQLQSSFREQLEQKRSAYEVDHPEIAYLVRQVLDILAKMGI